jgi:2-polyprenyl-6-methoxyphenol hydroxylase-like FAD-dependent oxidoreductase
VRVLISGGGIAGPALAFWLCRRGIEVTVVERAPGLRPGGHAVDVRGVARRVVEQMGLMAAMPADLFGGEGIVAEIEIARGDLARILHDATSAGAGYRFGDRITALTQDADGVDVTFARGDAGRFDVVIGADGVHSGVRALAFGPDRDFVRYLGGYTAYFTVPDPGDLENWFQLFSAPGGRTAGLRPERGGTAKASLGFRTPTPAYEGAGVAEQQRVLAERLAGVGWKVPSLLAAMPQAADFYFDSINQVRVDQWWRGRVALLGDAGYCGSPLAGLGTSMALVGAYVLAGELAAAPGDPGAAFAAYQGEMADYVAAGLELPPGGIAMFAPNSRALIALRGLSWRMMNHWPMRGILAKQFTKAEAITLKPYTALGEAPVRLSGSDGRAVGAEEVA